MSRSADGRLPGELLALVFGHVVEAGIPRDKVLHLIGATAKADDVTAKIRSASVIIADYQVASYGVSSPMAQAMIIAAPPYNTRRHQLFGRIRRLNKERPELDGVVVFAPDGVMIGRIALPERCANLCFGGLQRNRLFMAASQSIYALYVNTQGALGG